MSTPTRPNTFSNGQPIEAAEVNSDLNTLYNWIRDQAMHRDGTNAFTALPEGPSATPSGPFQLANKQYVDEKTANVAKKTDAVNTFSGKIRVADGTADSPSYSFDAHKPSGIWYANGLCLGVDTNTMVQLRAGDGLVIFNNPVHFNGRLWGPGMGQTSAGGLQVRRTGGSGNELYADTSRRATKTNIRQDGVGNEYVAKLLDTALPTWDALLITEDGVTEADPNHDTQTRGTAWDRIGPIVEDMQKVFPEAVVTDENGKPMAVDDSLVLRTLWHGFKRLVEALDLPEGWLD